MAQWLSRAVRGLGTNFRLLVNNFKTAEAKEFCEMAQDLNPESSPNPCIDYFLDHFARMPPE
jgi:hypothetical protein